MSASRWLARTAAGFMLAALAGCGGGGSGGGPATPWSSPVLAETDNAGNALGPQIAIDADGSVLAVWQRYETSGSYRIWSNRYAVGTGWGKAELIQTGNTFSAEGPRIAVDANGNGLAVWYQYDASGPRVWSNRYTAGTGWGTAALISNGGVNPQIAIDANGNALAVWEGNGGIAFNRYTLGTGWGTDAQITGTFNAYRPQIAIEANGDALAVWQQASWDGITTSTFNYIWSSRYTVGAGWGTATRIQTNGESGNQPQIAIDANGNALAVWADNHVDRGVTDYTNLWSNRYTAGAGWGTPVRFDNQNEYQSFPQILFDAKGNALAVWGGTCCRQGASLRSYIWSNRYTAGTGWSTAELIPTDNSGDPFSPPRIAIDSNGNALAVWEQAANPGFYSRFDIWYNRYAAGTGWGKAALIETDNAGDASAPQIAMNSKGKTMAVWSQFDGAHSNIMASHYN